MEGWGFKLTPQRPNYTPKAHLLVLKKRHIYNLYRISYALSFWLVMYYVVLEVCVGGRLRGLLFLLFVTNDICCG